ncbi:MAG TPA: VOC family protein, partial [Gemmatimonadaceae bacterium]|nr:VOC family protein [Gemmatimonadaceae bacterium]
MTTNQIQDTARDQYGIRPKGYRLPESTHLGRVRLQVADLERSLRFYEAVLGMRVIERTPDSVSLGPDGQDREIVHLRQLRSARPVPRRGLLGLYHFAILLPDRASLGRFVAHLAEIGERAGMSDHFVSEAVYLTDPDGLGIEVYADRPRGAWRYDERQLFMTTDHLDVDDLVRSARGEKWKGMP